MSKPHYAAAALILCLTTGEVLAGSTADPVRKHARTSSTSKTGSATPRSMGAFGISNSLNAPSTDFSRVTPDTGEPESRRYNGPVVRPSIDSNGNPVMGLGF